MGWFVGTFLDVEGVNKEFLNMFNKADIIIAKGMGNYESLTEYKFNKPVYILMKAKCLPVARHAGVHQGALVIKKLK